MAIRNYLNITILDVLILYLYSSRHCRKRILSYWMSDVDSFYYCQHHLELCLEYLQCNHHEHIPKVTSHTEYIQCNQHKHIPKVTLHIKYIQCYHDTFLRIMLHIEYIQCYHHEHIPKVTLHIKYIQCYSPSDLRRAIALAPLNAPKCNLRSVVNSTPG